MKRLITRRITLVSLAFLLTTQLGCTSVLAAEGKLSVTQKNFLEFDGDDTAYFFAKIENTGDAPIGVGKGKLVGFSQEDEIVVSTDYITTSPSYLLLQPGEHAYIREMEWESALKTADVVDYKFSIGTYEYPESYAVLPSEATFELKGNYDNYIYTTFTNTTSEILYDLYLTSALFDAEGNLIFVDGNSSSSVGVHPQNTVTLKTYIDGDILKYYQAHGITISSVESIVYYEAE